MFITNHVNDINILKQQIENADENITRLKKYSKNNRIAYPLGRIITYDKYLLLAFTEFNEYNEANLTKSKYEKCLRNMWREICRTYSNYRINILILGAGLTRIRDWHERTDLDIIKYMLYTLYFSNVDIRQPITIYISKEKYNSINIYELNGLKL